MRHREVESPSKIPQLPSGWGRRACQSVLRGFGAKLREGEKECACCSTFQEFCFLFFCASPPFRTHRSHNLTIATNLNKEHHVSTLQPLLASRGTKTHKFPVHFPVILWSEIVWWWPFPSHLRDLSALWPMVTVAGGSRSTAEVDQMALFAQLLEATS
jgi:hypothetical protein